MDALVLWDIDHTLPGRGTGRLIDLV